MAKVYDYKKAVRITTELARQGFSRSEICDVLNRTLHNRYHQPYNTTNIGHILQKEKIKQPEDIFQTAAKARSSQSGYSDSEIVNSLRAVMMVKEMSPKLKLAFVEEILEK